MAIVRLKKLKCYAKLKSAGCPTTLCLETIGGLWATYHRWLARYRQSGWRGLESMSRRPKRIRQRLFQGHFKRWCYGMRARRAGELVQVDHMSVALYAGFGIQEFKAAGPVTGIIVLKAYRRASSHCAKDFLEYLIAQAPFKIRSIQV